MEVNTEEASALQDLLASLVGSNVWWLALIPFVVAGAKMITIWTPTQWDNRILDAGFRFVNILALNIGKDRNADDADKDKNVVG
jgi:hypothetical protein